jgi:RimJ/RimL family protein N-acetyltransferase
LLIKQTEGDPRVHAVIAETHADNLPSQFVLRRNGFVECGTRSDSREGDLIRWRAA